MVTSVHKVTRYTTTYIRYNSPISGNLLHLATLWAWKCRISQFITYLKIFLALDT